MDAVYSLGVILYQLLSGSRPFQGEGPSQVLYKIVTEPPAPLDLASLGEPGPRLQVIVERALAKDREERYQGAGELADDIPSNHKFAPVAVAAGEPIIKYGLTIGRATRDIQRTGPRIR
mgnify:CR=1 FL=1